MKEIIPLWLVLAGLPSLLYAVTNHIDKHLLEKYFKSELGVNSLLVISSIVSVVAVPFIWFYSDASLVPETWMHFFVFVFVGVLHTALIWFYLKALDQDDTTTIIIFYSLLPVIGLLAAGLFLGEKLLPMQYVAMVITIFGVLVISFEGYRFKLKVAGLMFMASLCWAIGDVAFKYVAIEENIMMVLFWEHIILTCIGLVLLTLMPKVRSELKKAWRLNGKSILGISLFNEGIYITGNIISAFPLLMVQIAAVQLVESMQPVWVFVIAILLWVFGLTKKGFTLKEFAQKSLATSIVVYGMYLLAVSTP